MSGLQSNLKLIVLLTSLSANYLMPLVRVTIGLFEAVSIRETIKCYN